MILEFLILSAVIFTIGVTGIFLNRRNMILMIISIEIMLLSVNLNFISFAHYLNDVKGQVFVIFILAIAAAETAIGLAILVVYFGNKGNIEVTQVNTMKG